MLVRGWEFSVGGRWEKKVGGANRPTVRGDEKKKEGSVQVGRGRWEEAEENVVRVVEGDSKMRMNRSYGWEGLDGRRWGRCFVGGKRQERGWEMVESCLTRGEDHKETRVCGRRGGGVGGKKKGRSRR